MPRVPQTFLCSYMAAGGQEEEKKQKREVQLIMTSSER